MSFVTVESLDHEGRGVAHVEGKTIFIAGALPYEEVSYSSYRKKPNFENADVQEIRRESYLRTRPACPHFGVCGGCAMQHLEANAQVAAKQRVLEDNLQRLGHVTPDAMLPAIYGPTWGYRHRARLSVRRVEKKGGMLIGFHEKRSTFIADMTTCKVLPPHVSDLLLPLRSLIDGLSINTRLPQVEVAVGSRVTALVLRIMDPLTANDEQRLRTFADHYGVQFWLQTKGPDTAEPFYPLDAPQLSYELPEFSVTMPYRPTEFTQVNPGVNEVLVKRAVDLLDPQPGEVIADMFCGLGNFTLPIARRGATVLGVEGSQQLVDRGRANAVRNGLESRTRYAVSNLFEVTTEQILAWGQFDKMLIDPPRDGAVALVTALPEPGPRRIVYVSCNPATLARDAGILVNVKGYRLRSAGVVNMFPHTGHVESIAIFEKEQRPATP